MPIKTFATRRLPVLSIAISVLLLAGFVSLNAFSFRENFARLDMIEAFNNQSLPRAFTEIHVNLSRLNALADSPGDFSGAEKEDFLSHLDLLDKKLNILQSDYLTLISTESLARHFTVIRDALKKIATISAAPGLADPKARLQMKKSLQSIHNDFFQIELLAQAQHQSKINEHIVQLKGKERQLVWFGGAFVVFGCALVLLLLVDLFRHGALLQKARQAERLKNSFFAMMSHEIRTPINGVLGTLRLLQDTPLTEPQQQLTRTARHSAESLLAIVNDVLDYSKLEAGRLEIEPADFHLKDLVESVFELMQPLAQAKNLKLSYTLQPDLPVYVRADPIRIRQILLNFFSNAIKFTDTGFIRMEVQREKRLLGGTSTDFLLFNVIDSGMGIGAEARKSLFREFSQVDDSRSRRFEGTGLGLAICRRLTETMKGHIGVTSEPGKGSIFWFSIPLSEARAPDQEQAAALPASAQAAHILLVEDNATNQMIAEAFLKKGGHGVVTANNGREAVEAVKNVAFDMVFMDISMPEMDGLAATRAIRSLGGKARALPIIAMTAHAMRGDREECLQGGMNDYIAKPMSREALLLMVSKWAGMEKPRQRQAPMQPTEGLSEMHLNQIISDLGHENIGLVAAIFYKDVRQISAALLDAAGRKDWAEVQNHAHSIKSSALNFGLVHLSERAALVEGQCKNRGKAEAKVLQNWNDKLEEDLAALSYKFVTLGIPPLF